MATLILAVAALICCFGWLNERVCNSALMAWILDKGVELPGPEIKEYLVDAWKTTLGINT